MKGRLTTKGRIEYQFLAFGAITIVLVEVKLAIITPAQRLNAIAQVIAECDTCDFNNMRGNAAIPVYGILCDGRLFQFFSFESHERGHTSDRYVFSMGLFPGDPFQLEGGLSIVDFSSQNNVPLFIRSLRPVCEVVFNLMLVNYIPSLSIIGKESDLWEEPTRLAKEALSHTVDAETQRRNDMIADADSSTGKAIQILKLCIDAIPNAYREPICLTGGWNDDMVSRL